MMGPLTTRTTSTTRRSPPLPLLFLTTFLTALTLLPLASCSLYPTHPIQSTTWRPGDTVSITWRDDGVYPALGDMGRCDVMLFFDGDTYVTTLASDVDPEVGSVRVVVPEDVGDGSKQYTLRFVTDEPYDMIVYSADFSIVAGGDGVSDTITITSASSDTGTSNVPTAPYGSTTPTGTTNATLSSQGRMTTTTTTSSTSATSTGTASTTGATPSLLSSDRSSKPSTTTILSAPPLRPGDVSGASSQQQQQQQGTGPIKYNNKNAGRRIDVEKIKFRVVFVIWPVLMGITMAM